MEIACNYLLVKFIFNQFMYLYLIKNKKKKKKNKIFFYVLVNQIDEICFAILLYIYIKNGSLSGIVLPIDGGFVELFWFCYLIPLRIFYYFMDRE